MPAIDWERITPPLVVFALLVFSGLFMCCAWWSALLDVGPLVHLAIVVAGVAVSFVLFFIGYEIVRKEFTE
jgi:uncharacterized protein (DUF486 family)